MTIEVFIPQTSVKTRAVLMVRSVWSILSRDPAVGVLQKKTVPEISNLSVAAIISHTLTFAE